MTNVTLLKERIAKSGYKSKFVAEQIGLTPQALSMRLKNGTDFNVQEILTLTKLFKLTAAEQRAIFFCLES